MGSHVLYLGMAEDIMSPLLLVPDLEVIFVIDLFDEAYSSDKTFEGQKNDLKRTLLDGNDESSHVRIAYNRRAKWNHPLFRNVHVLPSTGEILSESDDGNVWRLTFRYCNRDIKLIFFHHR